MSKKYNFFGALEVAGFKRRLRYENGAWYKYSIVHNKAYLEFNDKNSELTTHVKEWWPSVAYQKEEAWEVEPEEKRWLFKGHGLEHFQCGDVIVKFDTGQYAKEGAVCGDNSIPDGVFKGMSQWFEVIEKVELEEIIVYGVCDDNGKSNIFGSNPIKTDGEWFTAGDDSWIGEEVLKNNLFPKDKPQKYKLVPVEKDEIHSN